MPQMFYIIPVPEVGGQPPVGIWPSPGHPAHPIHNPWPGDPGFVGPGGGTWGGAGQPGPFPPPGTWGGAGQPGPFPNPPGTWGGAGQPFPTPPIHLPPNRPGEPPTIWPSPGHPAHPIVLPPDPPPQVWPDPPGRPPGGQTGSISNPINLPPAGAGGTQPGFWALAYFQELKGWVWVWVPVANTPEPPPAKPSK